MDRARQRRAPARGRRAARRARDRVGARDPGAARVVAAAIENRRFFRPGNQTGEPPAAPPLRWALDDRRSLGRGPRAGARQRLPHRRGARPRAPGADPPRPAGAGQSPPSRIRLAAGGAHLMATARSQAAADKRRLILDAAVRAFARNGFHACRVSDIADEAGVAYGLVYHYFDSKDEVLDTLFLDRWNVLLELIRETYRRELPARDKLYAIASFIIDSYRHDPELMKVIIVEVTRAANTFGRRHIGVIRDAYAAIADIVAAGPRGREIKTHVPPQISPLPLSCPVGYVLPGWSFGVLPRGGRPV